MIVTTGRPRHELLGRVLDHVGRRARRRRLSSRTASKPNSEAISSIWSKSSRWLTVTMSPSSLNANWTIWVAGTFIAVGELGDRDELVDPDPGLLPLLLLGQPACLYFAVRRLVRAAYAFPAGRPSCPAASSGCSPAPHPDRPSSAYPSCPSCGRHPSRHRARRFEPVRRRDRAYPDRGSAHRDDSGDRSAAAPAWARCC